MKPERATSRVWMVVRRVVVFLILGAMVNVGVGWFAAWQSSYTEGQYIANPPRWAFGYPDPTGVLRRGFAIEAYLGTWGNYSQMSDLDEQLKDVEVVTPGSDLVADDSNGAVWTVATGWPAKSLRSESWNLWTKQEINVGLIRGGIEVDRNQTGWASRTLPLSPIWSGFILNTLLYAALLYVPFLGFSAFKRRRRIHRGLCPACAYDLAGLAVCPECGSAPSPRRGEDVTK